MQITAVETFPAAPRCLCVTGLGQALRDIAGRVPAAPVHELLGGPVRDWSRLHGVSWAWPSAPPFRSASTTDR